jgi:hypothetical protein
MSTGIRDDLDQVFQSEPQTNGLVGSRRNNGTGNGIQGQCHTDGLASSCGGFAAWAWRWKAYVCVARLPQHAALYRKDIVVDECLEAVAAASLEILGGRPKRRMRPLFDGIQICGNRLKGVSQSSQIGADFGIHGRHRKPLKLTN